MPYLTVVIIVPQSVSVNNKIPVSVLLLKSTKTRGADMVTLYERIISLCKERGIKGGKLCTEIGISKGTLTDLKMGRQTSLSAPNAQKIADYFGVTVGYLLGKEEKTPTVTDGQKENPDQPELTEEDRELLKIFKLIPEDAKRNFLEMGRLYAASLHKD